jgi:hypothetical protein
VAFLFGASLLNWVFVSRERRWSVVSVSVMCLMVAGSGLVGSFW